SNVTRQENTSPGEESGKKLNPRAGNGRAVGLVPLAKIPMSRQQIAQRHQKLNGTRNSTAPHFVGYPLARENVVPLVHIYPTKSQKDKKKLNGTRHGMVSRSLFSCRSQWHGLLSMAQASMTQDME
ncbi:hypothetical protein Tco_1264752, partial [Tanacetum coccineum]